MFGMGSSREYAKQWREKRKALGLCCTCGSNPARPGKRQCEPCGVKRRARENARYRSGLCTCGQPRPEGKRYCAKCLDRWRKWYNRPGNKRRFIKYANAKNAAIRIEVLTHYGAKCVCCGESSFPFLTLDHKRNGKEDRQACNSGYWWRYVRKMGYPDHLQVLCWNCNMAKQHFGGGVECPHKLTQSATQPLASSKLP